MRRTALVVTVWSACLLIEAGILLPLVIHPHGIDVLDVGWVLAWCGLPISGAVIVSRRPQNHVGLAMMGIGGAMAIGMACDAIATQAYGQGHTPGLVAKIAVNVNNWIYSICFVLLMLLVLLFPQGRLTPRWRWPVRLLLAALGVVIVGIATRQDVQLPRGGHVLNPFYVPALGDAIAPAIGPLSSAIACFAIAAVAWAALRYHRSTGDERLQRKWLAIAALAGAGIFVVSTPFGSSGNLLALLAMLVGLNGIAAAIAAAVLRYHLYDVDRVLSRTVSYLLLSGALVATYFALVALSTRALHAGSSFGVAVSTLVAAGLFQPLRRRLQHAVDRRFNRAKYDAERVVERFAAGLRDQVDVATVEAQLIAVARRTVDPSSASLWLATSSS